MPVPRNQNPTPLTIAFATRSVPMTGRTPWERCLGGSESAMVFASRGLAALGHHVFVFSKCDAPGVYDDVTWLDISTLEAEARLRDWDVFVSLRFLDLLEKDIRADLRVLWSQDVLHGFPLVHSLAWCDLLVFVSEWHRQDTIRHNPGIEAATAVVENGIDLSIVPAGRNERQPPLLVHLSRPERGLRALLEAWPAIRARCPGAELAVARYRSFHEPAGSQVEAFCATMDAAVREMPGASHLGNLSKPELYALLSRATAMVYPAEFDETSCIAAIEAQACGTPVVAVRRGALPETLAPDACRLVEPGDDMVVRFADTVGELIFDPEQRAAMSTAGRARAVEHDALVVAAKWEALFIDRLAARSGRRAVEVARTLAHRGDADAAVSTPREAGSPFTPAAARWPGLRAGLRDAILQRLRPARDVVQVGGVPFDSSVEMREPGVDGRRAEVVLDMGSLLCAEDRAAHIRWLRSQAERVVHVLPHAWGAVSGQRVCPSYDDIVQWFGEANTAYTLEASVAWGVPARCWIVSDATSPPNPDRPERKRRYTRPTPTVSACLIVRDAAETLLTTLESLRCIADEIRIVDTGSRDHTCELIESFAARVPTPVHLRRAEWPDDFGVARNMSVEDAEADWVLWIDGDERLIGGDRLRRLLQTEHWEAYAIRQHNHIFDAGVTHVEIPFRVYRNHRGYRFFGAVHEHPEKELNVPIDPWTLAPGVEILHYGYLDEATRTRKLLGRNLRLLNLDYDRYPGRRLTDILYLRDCVNLARYDLRKGQPVRADHLQCLSIAIDRFEQACMPERGRFYNLGREYYENALALLGQGREISVAIGDEKATMKKYRVRRMDDAEWIVLNATRLHLNPGVGP